MATENQAINFNQLSLHILRKHGVTKAYHGSHRDNTDSILKLGLMSRALIQQFSVIKPHYVTNQLSWNLDARHHLVNFIRLSFSANHPMFHAKGVMDEIVWFEVDIERLLQDRFTCFFSDRNATDNAVTIQKHAFDWDYTLFNQHYLMLPEEEKERYQAEMLVEGIIPPQYIKLYQRPTPWWEKSVEGF